MLDQVCILITLIIPHTFAYETFFFSPRANHIQVLKINSIAGFVANYLCPSFLYFPGGVHLPRVQIGYSLGISLQKKEILVKYKPPPI